MSLEVGLPSNPVAANGGGAFGRKSGRTASDDSGFTGALGGFSAVLASVDDGTPAPEESEDVRDRRRKSHEANAALTVSVATNPEDFDRSEPDLVLEAALTLKVTDARLLVSLDSGRGPGTGGQNLRRDAVMQTPGGSTFQGRDSVSETMPAVKTVEGRLSSSKDANLGSDLLETGIQTDVDARPKSPRIVMGTSQGGYTGLLKDMLGLNIAGGSKTELVTDIDSEPPYSEFALGVVQDLVFDAAKTVNPSATLVAGNLGLVAPKLSSGLAGVKAKLAKDKVGDDASKGNEGVIASGGIVRPDEGSFRVRVSQEIKLLTQQASLSREAVDPQPRVEAGLELPKYGKAASELNLATLDAGGETSGQGAEFSTSASDISPSPPLDGFLATATDLDNSGAYWISGDLKNAKMKLGDATEGVVEVSISLQGNQAQVAFKADETMTRNALQDSGSELKEMLRRDGIELSGVSVGTSGAGDGGGDRERSRSESRPSTLLQAVAPSLESPALSGPTSSAQRLDLYV